MAGVAVADRAAQFAEVSDQYRAWLTALFGGTPQEKPQQYAASSPITYAERVQAPILVIQGYNDSRCPAGQMARYEVRMKNLGKPIHLP
jgi:dipeptidyl aminopeptidase/acylaminoacyl peptidase